MKACLDLHDFSIVNNRLDILLKLADYFDDFKVSLFTVPRDEQADWGPYIIRNQLKQIVKDNLDWIQIVPHGLTHRYSEMAKCNYEEFKFQVLPEIRKAFREDGLPYVNGFCAPHWRWTDGVTRALDEENWWGAVDRDKIMPTPKVYYKYNYLLNEPFWESKEPLKLHGHVYGTKNDVGLCYSNLLKLPKDTKWCFVTDFLETKYDRPM